MEVAPIGSCEDEGLAAIAGLSLRCADGVDFLLDELDT